VTDVQKQGGGFLLAVPANSPEEAEIIRQRLISGAHASGVEDPHVETVNLQHQSIGQAVRAMVGSGQTPEASE
jgi:hypothetical protein